MSVKIKLYNQEAKALEDMEVSDKVLGVKASAALLHQAVVAQMANTRQVLAHTKDRSEVRGGGKKPWKQKGTGRARVGSSRSPLWVGGGVTFGPTKDRNFSQKINKKMKQRAIAMALSDKLGQSSLAILDSFKVEEFKTKQVNSILAKFEKEIFKTDRRNILIISGTKDEKAKYSSRNLTGVKLINQENINIVDLLKYRNLLVTKDVIKKLEEQYSK
jgi:large subunit ribosomal protein L4